MKLSLLALGPFLLASAHAEDKPVKIRTHHFEPKYEERVALDEKGRAAAKAWIESADHCEYSTLEFPRKHGPQIKPEIFMLPSTCDDVSTKSAVIPYCGGAVVCESRTARFMIRDVYCKANSARSCPPARTCALATDLTRSLGDQPGTHQGKQTGLFQQDMRGWDEGDTNRYPWTAMNERELDEWARDHVLNDTLTKGDRYPSDTTTKGNEQ